MPASPRPPAAAPGPTRASLADLPAHRLGPLYAARDLSPVEVTRAVIQRIEAWEPRLHATWAFDAEQALLAARASEARWQRGDAFGPLDGVPVTLKENIATQGLPVPLGTAVTELVPAAADAPPAARLREAGAVFLARTTMPDWGMLSSGLSSFHALSRNPWRLDRNPGGSSAGAAAAAAAGYGPLHLGTDIGGSIRLPAGWCGVVGFKPSLGRIPIHPPYAGRVAGPLAREVRDVALAMETLARPDWRDAMSLPPHSIDWPSAEAGLDLRGLRLGLWLAPGWGDPLAPAVHQAIVQAAQLFEAAGAQVRPLAPFMDRAMIDGLDRFWRMRSWLDFQRLPAARQALLLPYIRHWIERGAQLSGAEVFEGYSQMGRLRDASVAALQGLDFVISPVSPEVAFPAEWASPRNDPDQPFEHIAYTVPWNMGEQPALALPTGALHEGLPIGLQIIGHRHDDLGVLRLGRCWERLRPSLPPWPAAPPA